MKALKILLAVVASLTALIVVAVLALALLVDPNEYKGYATAWVEERTGRPFAIEGDLELAFFPWLAIEGERVVVGHPAGIEVDEPFATVERIAARIRLYPLLERRFEVGSVRIDGARVNLVRGADGRGNWEDFGAGTASAPDDPASRAALLENLDIERIEIRDGEVRWHEEPGSPRYVLDNIALTTGRIRAGEPIDVSLAVNVEDTSSERRFDVETRSLVGLDVLRAAGDDAVVTLRDFALSLRAYDPTSAEIASTSRAIASTNGEIASGAIEAERFDALPDGSVDIGGARLDARLAPSEAAPAGLDLGAGWGALRFDPRAGDLAVDGLVTRVAGIAAEWQLTARNVIDAPRIEGELRVADAAVAAALETFGVALPDRVDPSAFGTIDASARFRAALSLAGAGGADGTVGPYRVDELALNDLSVAVLGSELRGDAALGDDGVLRANLEVPEHAPSDQLRALAAAYASGGRTGGGGGAAAGAGAAAGGGAAAGAGAAGGAGPAASAGAGGDTDVDGNALAALGALDLDAIDRFGFSGRIELGLADGRIALRDFRAALLGAEIAAALDAAPPADDGGGRVLSGTVRTTPIAAERIVGLLGELMPDAISPAELGPVALDARYEYDVAARRIALEDVALDVFGLAATGRAVIAGLGEAVSASGEAAVAPFSPRELMERFGQPVPATSDPTTLQRAALSARFEAGADGGRFRNIDLALDDTRITGEYAIDGLANPAHEFALAIDAVNVDRYLPPRSSDLPEDADDDAQTAGDIELPVEALASLRIDGNVTVGDLRLAGLEFRDVATRIAIGDGRATLDSARASLYGGEFAGSFEVDTTEQPSLRLVGRATSLALDPIITALTGDANVSGTGDFDLDLAGTGATVLDNVETANGRVTFSMRDGAIEGFNLGRALCVVYNTARRLPGPEERPSRTEYVSIGGTAQVVDGVASSRDLLARTSFMDLTGAGHLALAEQRLDYTLEAKLTGSTGIPGCEEMGGLIGESLPLTLRGTVTDPAIRPDFSEIIQRRLRDALQDRLQDRLRDLLR